MTVSVSNNIFDLFYAKILFCYTCQPFFLIFLNLIFNIYIFLPNFNVQTKGQLIHGVS